MLVVTLLLYSYFVHVCICMTLTFTLFVHRSSFDGPTTMLSSLLYDDEQVDLLVWGGK